MHFTIFHYIVHQEDCKDIFVRPVLIWDTKFNEQKHNNTESGRIMTVGRTIFTYKE